MTLVVAVKDPKTETIWIASDWRTSANDKIFSDETEKLRMLKNNIIVWQCGFVSYRELCLEWVKHPKDLTHKELVRRREGCFRIAKSHPTANHDEIKKGDSGSGWLFVKWWEIVELDPYWCILRYSDSCAIGSGSQQWQVLLDRIREDSDSCIDRENELERLYEIVKRRNSTIGSISQLYSISKSWKITEYL